MRGYPKHLNTKQDVINLLQTEYADRVRGVVRKLYDERQAWIMSEKLDGADSGITDDTHRIEEITNEEGIITERYQYEYKTDPSCRLYALGFTEEEAEEIINGTTN